MLSRIDILKNKIRLKIFSMFQTCLGKKKILCLSDSYNFCIDHKFFTTLQQNTQTTSGTIKGNWGRTVCGLHSYCAYTTEQCTALWWVLVCLWPLLWDYKTDDTMLAYRLSEVYDAVDNFLYYLQRASWTAICVTAG